MGRGEVNREGIPAKYLRRGAVKAPRIEIAFSSRTGAGRQLLAALVGYIQALGALGQDDN